MIRPSWLQARLSIPPIAWTAGLLGLGLLAAAVVAGAEESPPEAQETRPREIVQQWLGGERDRLAGDLERAHGVLVARAERENPALLERLSLEPPKPRAHGYGILPQLLSDQPFAETTVKQQRYSLEQLTTAYAGDLRDAALLALRSEELQETSLEPMVATFERLRKRLKNFEDHLDYHDYWQQAAVDYKEFYAEKNRTLTLVEEWQALEKVGGDEAERTRVRQEIAERLKLFRPTPGLALEEHGDGTYILPVKVLTDIADEAFLGAFRDAVEQAFARSPAARAQHFRLELELELVPPASLYPDGAPEVGAKIQEADHLAKFPKSALILTTGAKSTHATVGRAIHLGSAPIRPRTLAHEFGHLLGFSDGYLRAHRGAPEDPWGVVFVEWTGLAEGLMGAPGSGRVTESMIDQLLEAYSISAP